MHKGILRFKDWQTYLLETETRPVELSSIIDIHQFLASVHGKRGKLEKAPDSFMLRVDPREEYSVFTCRPGKHPLIVTFSGWITILPPFYTALNELLGRRVTVDVEMGEYLKVAADPSEQTFGVYFKKNGNSCELPKGAEQVVCRVNRRNGCIFLSVGADGFACEKFNSPVAHEMLMRLSNSQTNSRGIGNCSLLGRKES